MKSGQKIQQARLSKWAVLFQEQASSGLTIKDWCIQNDVSIHAFYYWKRIAKETYVNSLIPDIVPLPMANAPFLPDASPSAPAEHELQSADSNGRFCGAKRTRCGASGLIYSY